MDFYLRGLLKLKLWKILLSTITLVVHLTGFYLLVINAC